MSYRTADERAAWVLEKNGPAVLAENTPPRLAPLAERISAASYCSVCLADDCVCQCSACSKRGWSVYDGMCCDCRDAEPCDTCGGSRHSGPCHDETPEAVMYGVRA